MLINHRQLSFTLRVPAFMGMCILISSQVMLMLMVRESHFETRHSRVLESGLWWVLFFQIIKIKKKKEVGFWW